MKTSEDVCSLGLCLMTKKSLTHTCLWNAGSGSDGKWVKLVCCTHAWEFVSLNRCLGVRQAWLNLCFWDEQALHILFALYLHGIVRQLLFYYHYLRCKRDLFLSAARKAPQIMHQCKTHHNKIT